MARWGARPRLLESLAAVVRGAAVAGGAVRDNAAGASRLHAQLHGLSPRRRLGRCGQGTVATCLARAPGDELRGSPLPGAGSRRVAVSAVGSAARAVTGVDG